MGRRVLHKVYIVVVSNIGQVYQGHSKKEAIKQYNDYIARSLAGTGRVADEGVTLFCDGEIVAEHHGAMTDW